MVTIAHFIDAHIMKTSMPYCQLSPAKSVRKTAEELCQINLFAQTRVCRCNYFILGKCPWFNNGMKTDRSYCGIIYGFNEKNQYSQICFPQPAKLRSHEVYIHTYAGEPFSAYMKIEEKYDRSRIHTAWSTNSPEPRYTGSSASSSPLQIVSDRKLSWPREEDSISPIDVINRPSRRRTSTRFLFRRQGRLIFGIRRLRLTATIITSYVV